MVTLSVPEIRDYQRVNRAVQQALDAGATHVRLGGVEGQRLLLARIACRRAATVELLGDAGPELCFALDAPELRVLCRGNVADGAGSCLRAGQLVIFGDAGVALAYSQHGGSVVCLGSAGARAGLLQAGGVLVIAGDAGDLLGDHQLDGLIVGGTSGSHRGNARRGGRLFVLKNELAGAPGWAARDRIALHSAVTGCETLLPETLTRAAFD